MTQYFNEPYKNMKNTARDLLIGSIRYASKSILMWNLVLRKDEDGFTTPHLPNVCLNCNAAILLLPESTDQVQGGDPNHTLSLAEATGGTAKKDDKKDPTAPATAPATAPVNPASSVPGSVTPGAVTTDDKKKAAPGATTDDKKDPAVAPAVAPAVVPGTLSKRRLDLSPAYLRRRANTNTFTVPDKTDDTTAGTGIVPTRGTRGGGSEAILASKVVDAKKTGRTNVYESDLLKRTSDFSVLSHLSTAVRPDGASKSYSKRIGVVSTDELTDLGGRLLAQAFRQDGVKPGVTRFSVILLNQNDHYETGIWEELTTVIAFRGMVANVTTVPGLYTLSWEAPTVAPETQTDLSQSGAEDKKAAAAGAGGSS